MTEEKGEGSKQAARETGRAAQRTVKAKILAVVFGIVSALILLEVGLRAAGTVILSSQRTAEKVFCLRLMAYAQLRSKALKKSIDSTTNQPVVSATIEMLSADQMS